MGGLLGDVTRHLAAKGLTEKKIFHLIKTKFLSPIEQRMICYKDCEKTIIEIDDINNLKYALEYKYGFERDHTIFTNENTAKRFLTYSICFFYIADFYVQHLVEPSFYP